MLVMPPIMKAVATEQKTWKLKLTLLLVSSLTIMSVITIAPALPQMALVFADVENGALLVKLVLTLPALLIALCAPIAGGLIDRHGRLRILWLALVLYALAGAGGYFLDNLYHLLISRAVLGMSVGMSMTIVVTLIADYFEGRERQQFVGLQIAFMSLGGILFIGLAGILADYGWRYPFLIYLSSLLLLPLSITWLHEPAAAEKRSRLKQQAHSPPIIRLLLINTLLMWVFFFLIPVQIPFHLQALGIGKSSLIGAAIAISTAFSAVSSFSYSRIKVRFSFMAVFSMGYFLLAAGFVCLAVSHTYVVVVVAMMLSGLGMGMMIPNTNMWVMKIAPPEIRGKEIGKLTTFWFLGQFLSPVIIFPVLNLLSLPATFLLASGVLLLLSLAFLVFQFSNTGKLVTQ